MNEQQPMVLIKAMREIAHQHIEYSDQKMVEMLLLTWQQKAEIEDLKKTITELAKSLKDNEE